MKQTFKTTIIILLAFCIALSLTGCKSEEVKMVEKQINDLSKATEIKLSDLEEIESAYYHLSDEDKKTVKNYGVYEQVFAKYIDEEIDKIGEITFFETGKKIDAIDSVLISYEWIADCNTDVIANYDKYENIKKEYRALEEKTVTEKIDAIGDVTFTPECDARIRDARSLYDKISSVSQKNIKNYETLIVAEHKYLRMVQIKEENENKKSETDPLAGYYNIQAPQYPVGVSTSPQKVTTEYKNALEAAREYAELYLSKQGIYDQLVSEYGGKFPKDAAQYAIDNLKVDYKANALKVAEDYYYNFHMSKAKIYEQLTSKYGSKFTDEEATYAINHLE